ncbi:acyltransferase [Micromonospora sediminicola]|uniref:acyltransferase family protein n=1 Tax=Micromonospora sediminicola TaxID=946078 RepID=UPI0033D86BE5
MTQQIPASLGQAGPKAPFLPSLNGGRAIAAVLVFGGHFLAMQFATQVGAADIYEAEQGRGLTDQFMFMFFGIFIPVPINYFFIVSGFVLAWTWHPGRTATGFWRRRFGKVYPVYAVTSLLAFIGFGLVANFWHSWKVLLTHTFLLQAWTPDQRYLLALNPVMWTLSSEIFLYLLFPALIIVFVQMPRRALQITALACVVLAFLLPYLAGQTFDMRQPAPPVLAPLEGYDNAFSYWFTLMFPPLRLFQFALGMAVALLMKQGMRFPGLPIALPIFAVGLVLTNLYLPVEVAGGAGMLVPLVLVVAALVQRDVAGKRTGLTSAPMLFLGKISFSFYAIHILFILFTIVQVPVPSGAWDRPRLWLWQAGVIDTPTEALPGWANILLFFTYLAVTTFAAWLLHRFVEEPMNKIIRGRRRPQPPTPPQAPISPVPANHVPAAGTPNARDTVGRSVS